MVVENRVLPDQIASVEEAQSPTKKMKRVSSITTKLKWQGPLHSVDLIFAIAIAVIYQSILSLVATL